MQHFLSTTNQGPDYKFNHFVMHVLLGLVMLVWPATWLAYNVLQRHYRSVLSDGQTPFRSRLWYPGPCSKRVPMDSVVRIVVCLSATIYFNYISYMMKYYRGIRLEDQQHGIVTFSNFVAGFFEVLVSLTGSERKAPTSMMFPAGVDRAASMLSAMVAVFVFSFHFHGETALQMQLHGYYSWLSMALFLSHAVEVLGQRHVWMALVRPYVMFLIGIWSIQIGFVLYPLTDNSHTWEDSGMDSKIMVDFLMCCHLMMAFISFVTMALFVSRWKMAINQTTDINKYGVKYQPLPRDV